MKTGTIKINEAAAILGVSVDTLRDWEEQGKVTPQRTAGGHRRYGAEELAPLWAQQNGISVERALAELKGEIAVGEELPSDLTAEDAKARLDAWFAEHPTMPLGLGMLYEAVGGGLRRSHVGLVQGRAGSGKTILLDHAALTLAAAGRNVVFVTLEYSAASMTQQLAAQHTKAGTREVGAQDAAALLPTSLCVLANERAGDGAYTPMTVARLRAIVNEVRRTRFAGGRIDAVIVDPMTLLALEGRSSRHVSYEAASREIAEALFHLAKSLDLLVLTSAQARKVAAGHVCDLYEAGSSPVLEYCDLVVNVQLPVHPSTPKGGRLETAIVKNRHGAPDEQAFKVGPRSLALKPKPVR